MSKNNETLAAVSPLAAGSQAEAVELAQALTSALAIIEFSPKGRITKANQNFLDLMGYELDDVIGSHHRIFVDPVYARSPEYSEFWKSLAAGEHRTGEFKRLRRDGSTVFLKASYMAVRDADGQVDRVVKVAQDYTQDKLAALDSSGQIEAIGRSQAVVEFGLDGTIQMANENFLSLMGYSLEEVQGKHHSIFVDDEYGRSAEYRDFWQRLNQGKYERAEFKRFGKNGREVWIQASYNPILDLDGHPVKVVKYATDITEQKVRNTEFESQIEAITSTQAVVQFNLQGEILDANAIFLDVMGYSLDEVRGRHHRIFVDPEYARGAEYADFWRALGEGKTKQGQFRRVAKDGTERWLQASYTPIRDVDGKLRSIIKYATDLTAERRLRDEMLAELRDPIAGLATASDQLMAIASSLTSHAKKTSESSTTAAGRTDEVATAMQTVATSAEELTSTVREISRQTADGSGKALQAKTESDKANSMMTQLNASSKAIGQIIKTISAIAQQTNLLALNATIEAARAGEAGKGFAVVANEVKELAKQTAVATDDITNRVEAIQADSETAVVSIKTISQAIDALTDVSSSIATAVEEQAGTTNDVARIVAESATGVQGVSENIIEVNGMADQTLTSGQETEGAAKALGDMAQQLADTLDRLKSA